MADLPDVYRFLPRPEAHWTCWAEQIEPVRKSVHGLLARLAGAEAARAAAVNRALSNCFLVYGPRGTGKTTVLLSAREAVQHPERGAGFFPDPEAEVDELGLRALACAQELHSMHRIVWLDMLDLEPLPPSANLLTALLTRVSEAVDGCGERDRLRSSSIFEEGANDVRQRLDHLVNDATVMWEEIEETDTRNRANRQRAAAGIYAGFHGRFVESMNALVDRLGRVRGHERGSSIVLPIDNIDRSPEHLKAIVKLAQMVSHPRLWLVMAGDRTEVEAFLERAYWNELIHGRAGTDARGKPGWYSEDESPGMARRQAHAASRKVWPPSHRVEVDLVDPQNTLAFHLPGADGRSVRDLLTTVEVETFLKHDGSEPLRFKFIELFESGGDDSRLSQVAAKALHLPARGVLDLWQLTHYWIGNDPTGRVAAAMIAWTMLRGAFLAGSLPDFAVEQLRHGTVQRESPYRTLLDISDKPLSVGGNLSVAAMVPGPGAQLEAPAFVLRSWLAVRDERDMLLKVWLGWEPAVELDELSAAWMLILYDVLMYVPELAVLGAVSVAFPFVEVHHEAATEAGGAWRRCAAGPGPSPLPWPTPAFSTFGAHESFWRHWKAFRQAVPHGSPCPHCGADPCPSRLVGGWAASALQAFDDCLPRRGAPRIDGSPTADPVATLETAASIYDGVVAESRHPLPERRHVESSAMCRWLQSALPRLLTRAYLPMDGRAACRDRLLDWVKTHREVALVSYWRATRQFLWADIDANLASTQLGPETGPDLPKTLQLTEAQQQALQDWLYGDLREALE